MSEHVTTRISTGTLRGVRADGIDRYLGIPYAAAPIGDLRFREPQPAPAWDGVRDATTTGPTAPQIPYGPVTAQFLANVISPGDGYLNLNIWAPVGAASRPVMVWVHGGSFAHGSNALDGYDGSAFARDGIVLVSINYRLGTEGFSVLPGVPANLGLTDIAAALRWVRAEIAAFGGDPHNVTAFGESAGASAVGDLLGSPHAVELFDKAILQSGTPSAVHPERAGRITRRTAKRLGIPATREAFAAEPSSRLLAAEAALTANSSPVSAGLGFQAAISEPLLPREPLQAILDGAGDSIPVMLGWNAEETRLWLVPSGLQDRIGRLLFTAVRLRFRIGRRILRAYRAAFPAASRGQLLGEFATDFILRLPFHRIGDHRLARQAASTHLYEFAWRTPVGDLGAAHALEIGFVFDQLTSPDWIRLAGAEAPQSLADAMHAAWVRFATTGDPGWRAWDSNRPVMVFDSPSSRVVDNPREAILSAWRRRAENTSPAR
ncbi:para-nitrobenzyl esterase [Streptomyces sp. Ag109_O5-1]|uniref:carboxylesterase/lipase family protein n=1 Tax=Streptomyces sp. Ag109_O5-1 TaxID=1938851 RepID=UPI000F5034A7|nr:carboxylesterase family protein [Streptomyces sp. Ag109_O5-1]RPE39166.1 para-nitrobenzyl esterase [Streptomyces sp. Ag109_O5-1]